MQSWGDDSVRRLQHKHGGLSSVSDTHVKRQAQDRASATPALGTTQFPLVRCACDLSNAEEETGNPLWLAELAISRPERDPDS